MVTKLSFLSDKIRLTLTGFESVKPPPPPQVWGKHSTTALLSIMLFELPNTTWPGASLYRVFETTQLIGICTG